MTAFVGRNVRRDSAWPVFFPGHEESTKHGAHSARKVSPIAAELRGALLEVAPWCSAPAFAPSVEAWAWAEAQCRLMRDWLDAHGLFSKEGESTRSWLSKVETRAERLRSELGLSPKSWAALLGSVRQAAPESSEAAALLATGRQIVEAQQRALGAGGE